MPLLPGSRFNYSNAGTVCRVSGAWSTELRMIELHSIKQNAYREEKRLPSEELLHAKLPFFILEEESCICGFLCYLHKDVKKFGGASVPPSTYLSTAMRR